MSWCAFTGESFEEWVGYGWANAMRHDDREFPRNWSESVAQDPGGHQVPNLARTVAGVAVDVRARGPAPR
jgi:hypothetical protein